MSDRKKRPWGARLSNHFRKLAPGRERQAAEQWDTGERQEADFGALSGASRLPGLVAEDRLALFGDDAFNDARRYVLGLGLRRLLDPDAVARLSPLALQWLVCRRIGAKRCDAQGFDPAGQAAFFVVGFVLDHAIAFRGDAPIHVAERRTQGNGFVSNRLPDTGRIHAMLRLGRLLEWWRWREQGHDRAAVVGAKSLRASDAGRELLARERGAANRQRLARMTELFQSGLTVEHAAERAAREGFGPTGDANRRLWYRSQPGKKRSRKNTL